MSDALKKDLQETYRDRNNGYINQQEYVNYLAQLRSNDPIGFAERQEINTKATAEVLNKYAMGDMDWVTDPMALEGLEDGAYDTVVPFGFGDERFIKDDTGESYGVTRQVGSDRFRTDVGGKVLPDTLRHEGQHRGLRNYAPIPDEEYQVRAADVAYANKLGYLDPSGLDFLRRNAPSAEAKAGADKYINQYIKQQKPKYP